MGAALRRALVQPALKCGYRFSDDALLDEMLAEVEGERGALPLLAFAAARLWQERDRSAGLLTREAYEDLGGVAGALAQHAEATMDRVGRHCEPLVRELFRNLITAHGTRAARAEHELLSVFESADQDAAREVLALLVDARLLTSFEVETPGQQVEARRRFEIVHESLLNAWPRLVRWQTQDAEGAQLRDQLRQAARMWHERGRSDDLLWSGTAFREFQLWRDRYPGGLSETEEAFAGAMVAHASRRRRRRGVALIVAMVVLASLAAVLGGLWQRSEHQARRAEAARRFESARLRLQSVPRNSLAWIIASLELEDDPEVRRLAVQALHTTPMYLEPLPWGDRADQDQCWAAFSPDGRWLATGDVWGRVSLSSAEGGEPLQWRPHEFAVATLFTPDSSALLTVALFDPEIHLWSVPDGRELASFASPSWTGAFEGDMKGSIELRFVHGADGGWSVDERVAKLRRRLTGGLAAPAAVDATRESLFYSLAGELYTVPLAGDEAPRLVARHPRDFARIAVHPDGGRVATIDAAGELQLWPVAGAVSVPVRVWLHSKDSQCNDLVFDPSGSALAAAFGTGKVRLFGMDDPPDADPLTIVPFETSVYKLAFHPDGRWLATAGGLHGGAHLWPIDRPRHGYTLRGHGGPVVQVAFAPDGSWLASASTDGTVRVWPLRPGGGAARVVFRADFGSGLELGYMETIQVSPDGRFIAVNTPPGHVVTLVPVGPDPPREVLAFDGWIMSLAVGPRGRYVAASGHRRPMSEPITRVLDLDSGRIKVLDAGDGDCVWTVRFTPDGRLLAHGTHRLLEWDVHSGESRLLLESEQSTYGIFTLNAAGDVMLIQHLGHYFVYDLATGATVDMPRRSVALTRSGTLDPSGTIAVTASGTTYDPFVQVGPVTGEDPHLLAGHLEAIYSVAVSPDGRWIASGSYDGTIRLWPMPDLSAPPLHTLPYDELMARLRSHINYHLECGHPELERGCLAVHDPFPGWQTVPVW
jgi:WD40 repeat protein